MRQVHRDAGKHMQVCTGRAEHHSLLWQHRGPLSILYAEGRAIPEEMISVLPAKQAARNEHS